MAKTAVATDKSTNQTPNLHMNATRNHETDIGIDYNTAILEGEGNNWQRGPER